MLPKSYSKFLFLCVSFIAAGVAAQNALEDSHWQLVEFQSMNDSSSSPDQASYTMHLKGDGTVAMDINCNKATGTWSAKPSSDPSNGQFEFGPLAITNMACPDPGMDAILTNQTKYIRGYMLKDDRLYLSLMADGGIFIWEPAKGQSSKKMIYTSPENGGARNWETTSNVNLREQPSTDSMVLVVLEQGAILDNLGCDQYNGDTWCDVQTFGGGPRGFVSASYLKPAVSPDGSPAFGPDDSALRAGQGEFDATGSVSCSTNGQAPGQCGFGVARAGGGYATLVLTKPDGSKRAIYFRLGKPIGSDDVSGAEFKASKQADLYIIQVGDERFEVPEAAIFGG